MLSEKEISKLIGHVKGKLTVLEYDGYYAKEGNKQVQHWYKCKCECGNIVIVARKQLLSNSKHATTSCGCSRKRHGYHKHPAYNSYKGMITRVRRPDIYRHKNYILNNIKVCKEWDGNPKAFCEWADKNGYKKGLTLDRIDNLKDYEPSNCRWVTPLVQSNNRPAYNHNITYEGKTQSIAMWARELGIKENTLRSRLKNNHDDLSKAIKT